MQLEQFLGRVIPPGNYIAVGYHRTPGQTGNFGHGFFPGGDVHGAAGLLRWGSRKGFDAYHAMASFVLAETDGTDIRGHTKYKGRREQSNVQNLKAFWVDCDVKRPGDKKLASQCFATQGAALQWVAAFCQKLALPRFNLVVNSGYGLHCYWVLEDALPVAQWQPYAHALRAALQAEGLPGDAGISADAARVLRPPETSNHKNTAQPMPVAVLDKLTGPDVVNALLFTALRPYLGVATTTVVAGIQGVAAQTATISVLAGGQAAAALRSVPPVGMTAAAQANLPQGPPKSFPLVANQCAQVGHSLTQHGLGDSRYIWELGHLLLAAHCADGAAYIHPIGDGDPRYKPAETDQVWAKLPAIVAQGVGPPTCAHYEKHRPALCQACPHRGRITSPAQLGVPQTDLPPHYRRRQGRIEVETLRDGEPVWELVLAGDVSDPQLFAVDRDRGLEFTWSRGSETHRVSVVRGALPDAPKDIRALLCSQGVQIDPKCEPKWRDLLVSWIGDLIDKRATLNLRAQPWGWFEPAPGQLEGFAVAGKLYRADGSVGETAMPGVSAEIVRAYTPQGTLAKWQQSCAFVCKTGPDLQAIVAGAFAAPLMRLLGYSGTILSVWSSESGVGKSAAMSVGQAVWGSPTGMFSLGDTTLSTLDRIACTNAMPAYWDEFRSATPADAQQHVALLFSLTQGKERGRLRSDATQRPVRLWETLMVTCSNRSLIDQIVDQDEGTEAGAVRVFEYAITRQPHPAVPGAQLLIKQARENYGRAGEVYAVWLARHGDKARQILTKVQHDLETQLGAQQEERFQIAAMATLLTGAAIANNLKLTAFDWTGLRDFLAATFLDLRAHRRRELLVRPGGFDCAQILAQFVNEHSGRRLSTDVFSRRGPHGRRPKALHVPSDTRGGVVIHVAQLDKAMRIDRKAFLHWMQRRRLPGGGVVDAMSKLWVLTRAKPDFCGGTPWSAGQLDTLEIALTGDLEAYLDLPTEDTPGGPAERVRRAGLAVAPPVVTP